MIENQTILLVDDDEVDVMAVSRAIKELNVKNPVATCRNGEEALQWLKTHPKPGLVLLDLRMPVMDGLEFLAKVKGDLDLRKVPVVALTTSREETDRARAFDLGIAGFMVKPVDPKLYISVMRTISIYWKTSELPY
ncbi:MAG: response regulator [Elusimicrobia bacterium]|nr:response regulator [Elusimicrobiota bacterium]